MTSNSSIHVNEDGTVGIVGEMTFRSTPGLYREMEDHFQSSAEMINIDLGEVGQADSSGLALLLEWQAMSNRCNRELRIRNAPNNLLRLAKLCEAETLMNLSGR